MMIKTFTIFLTLVIVICKANLQSLRILTSEVSNLNSNITIPIISPYYVSIIIDENEKYPQLYPMMVSLYSSETIFNGFKDLTGQGFNTFDCKLPHCSKSSSEELDISLPRFTFHGSRVQVSAFLDKESWYFKQSGTYSPILVDSFNGSRHPFDNMISYGFLGMGRAKNGRHFPNIFSVYLLPETNGLMDWTGDIIIGVDLKKAKSKIPSASWHADENWHIHGIQAVTIDNSVIDTSVNNKIILDLNIDEIVFPAYFQNKIFDAFKLVGVICEWREKKIQCSKASNYKKFPTIGIKINGTKLEISPEMYLSNVATDGWIRTMLRFSSPQSTVEYVTPEYQHCIVLGRLVMREYYTVFNGVQEAIIFYKINIFTDNNSMFSFSNILMGLGVMLIVGYLWKRHSIRTKKDYEEFINYSQLEE